MDPLPSTIPADDVAQAVQQQLADLRAGLYGGRGPGIGEPERLRHTSLRADVGGIPVAAGREELHLRTRRIRGDRTDLAAEADWAAAQFPAQREDFAELARPARRRRFSLSRALAVLALALAGLRERRRR